MSRVATSTVVHFLSTSRTEKTCYRSVTAAKSARWPVCFAPQRAGDIEKGSEEQSGPGMAGRALPGDVCLQAQKDALQYSAGFTTEPGPAGSI